MIKKFRTLTIVQCINCDHTGNFILPPTSVKKKINSYRSQRILLYFKLGIKLRPSLSYMSCKYHNYNGGGGGHKKERGSYRYR